MNRNGTKSFGQHVDIVDIKSAISVTLGAANGLGNFRILDASCAQMTNPSKFK
jgi:hypothetical protein